MLNFSKCETSNIMKEWNKTLYFFILKKYTTETSYKKINRMKRIKRKKEI